MDRHPGYALVETNQKIRTKKKKKKNIFLSYDPIWKAFNFGRMYDQFGFSDIIFFM
jgi:hypothetical protein